MCTHASTKSMLTSPFTLMQYQIYPQTLNHCVCSPQQPTLGPCLCSAYSPQRGIRYVYCISYLSSFLGNAKRLFGYLYLFSFGTSILRYIPLFCLVQFSTMYCARLVSSYVCIYLYVSNATYSRMEFFSEINQFDDVYNFNIERCPYCTQINNQKNYNFPKNLT